MERISRYQRIWDGRYAFEALPGIQEALRVSRSMEPIELFTLLHDFVLSACPSIRTIRGLRRKDATDKLHHLSAEDIPLVGPQLPQKALDLLQHVRRRFVTKPYTFAHAV